MHGQKNIKVRIYLALYMILKRFLADTVMNLQRTVVSQWGEYCLLNGS